MMYISHLFLYFILKVHTAPLEEAINISDNLPFPTVQFTALRVAPPSTGPRANHPCNALSEILSDFLSNVSFPFQKKILPFGKRFFQIKLN